MVIRDGKDLLDHWVYSLQSPHREGIDFQCILDYIHNSQETKKKGTVDHFLETSKSSVHLLENESLYLSCCTDLLQKTYVLT